METHIKMNRKNVENPSNPHELNGDEIRKYMQAIFKYEVYFINAGQITYE